MTALALLALVAEVVIGSHWQPPLLAISENPITVPILEVVTVATFLSFVIWRYGDDGAKS